MSDSGRITTGSEAMTVISITGITTIPPAGLGVRG
jgi:cytochrome c5